MADDELHLNTLARFTKRGSRLHLEQNSHCEVPAGCGGVVLRWYDPAKGAPLRFAAVWRVDDAVVRIDGVTLLSGRPHLAFGPHVLTIEFPAAFQQDPVFMFASMRELQPYWTESPNPCFVSAPDGSWRYLTQPPPAEWFEPGFDDRAWPALGPGTLQPTEVEARHWTYPVTLRCGATALSPTEAISGPVWVRKVFHYTPGGGA